MSFLVLSFIFPFLFAYFKFPSAFPNRLFLFTASCSRFTGADSLTPLLMMGILIKLLSLCLMTVDCCLSH